MYRSQIPHQQMNGVSMRSLFHSLAVAAPLGFAVIASAQAATVSGTLTVVIAPPALAMIINPSNASEACEVPAGTVVSQLSISGGDGNPVTFALTPVNNGATDFVISGSDVVVGVNGIAAADCGETEAFTITASQP